MKKIFILIYLLIFPFSVMFGQYQVGVSIHDTTVVAGSIVEIPVYIDSSLTGQNVSSFNFHLNYSSSACTIDSVITSGTMTDGWGNVVYNSTVSGHFSVAGASQNYLAGTGILFYLRIRAISYGTYIQFDANRDNGFNEGVPGVILNSGYLNISNPPSITVSPDEAVIVTGDTKNFSVYGGTSPYTWSVTNPSVALINSSGVLTGLSKGTTKVVCVDNSGIIDTTSGVVEVRAFRLSSRDTSFYQGNIVDIPIYTSDLTGLDYTAGEINIAVDHNSLTPIQILTTGTILENYTTPQFSFRNDILNIAFAGTTPLVGSGILMIVRYKITSTNTGGTYLNFGDIVFNETDLGLGEDSYFDVLPLPNIYISPSTANVLVGNQKQFTASGGTPPYTWSVSNLNFASIDGNGLLTGQKGGVVKVTVHDAYGGSGVTENINIFDTEVSFPDTNMVIGTTIDYPLFMGNLASTYSIFSMQGILHFDSSKVHFEQVVTSGTLTNGWNFSINNNGNAITFAGAGASGFNSSGAVVKFRFSVVSGALVGDYSNVSLTDFLFNEGSPNALLEQGRITFITPGPPDPPSNLTATSISSSVINLTWSDNSSLENGFIVERKIGTGGSWSQLVTLVSNSIAYNDSGLTDGTEYFYRVYATSNYGNSGYSNIANAVTELNFPWGLQASAVSPSEIDLSWTDNSSSETGFVIEQADTSLSWAQVATVGANAVNYHLTGLLDGTHYYYRIYAYNSLVNSDYSNTTDTVTFLAAPTNLSGSVGTNSAVNLTWRDNSVSETGYVIERKSDTTSYVAFDTVAQNVTSFSDTNIVVEEDYTYRVYAINNIMVSGYSNEFSIHIPGLPPTSPDDLSLMLMDSTSVLVAWSDLSNDESGFHIERKIGASGSWAIIDSVVANSTEYLDSTCTDGMLYYYRVNAFNENGNSGYTNLDSIITELSQPWFLHASAVSSSEIDLSWTDKCNNETNFIIEQTRDTAQTWTQIAIVGANTTSYHKTGLSDGTHYYFRVFARTSYTNSPYSNIADSVTFLASPTNLSGTAESETSVKLIWTDNSAAEAGYILERKQSSGNFSVLDSVGQNVTVYSDSNLIVGENYTYRVRAYNVTSVSTYSNEFNYHVQGLPPISPDDLNLMLVDSTSVVVEWSDLSNNETGFHIERKAGYSGVWGILDSVSANTIEYFDSSCTDGILYYYRVNAFNQNGSSGYSNIDSVITELSKPWYLHATSMPGRKVKLSWEDHSANESGFIIERAEGNIGGSLLFTVIDTASANNTYYLDSNLTSAESYVYQIRAFNEYTESAYSNMAPVTLVGVAEEGDVPTHYEVFQNYPNPFSKGSGGSSSTTLKFNLPERSKVYVKVYNLLGSEVASLISKEMEEGYHQIKWNAGNIPSGVYIISFRFKGMNNNQVYSFIKKAILLK